MYSGRMVFTVTAMVFQSYLVIYVYPLIFVRSYFFPMLCFRGSRLTAVSCMRAGMELVSVLLIPIDSEYDSSLFY
jgi:hypothetical protein